MYRLLTRASQWYSQRKLVQHIEKLKRLASAGTPVETLVDEVIRRNSPVRAIQVRTEILKFLEIVRELQPRVVGEIGTCAGGTLFLLCQIAAPDARVLSIDLEYKGSRQTEFKKLAARQQTLDCWQMNSRLPQACADTQRWLAGDQFDVLLIDGDHRYPGVANDYRRFGPLVRPGGILAFHDIVPDHYSRFGVQTRSFTGGVPKLWQQIREHHRCTTEIVADYQQDGFGIGVVHVQSGESFDWIATSHDAAA